MSELICLLLQLLAARPPQRIIITAIHAPSSRLFTLFTHLTLLSSDGRLCYWGPREEVRAPVVCLILVDSMSKGLHDSDVQC